MVNFRKKSQKTKSKKTNSQKTKSQKTIKHGGATTKGEGGMNPGVSGKEHIEEGGKIRQTSTPTKSENDPRVIKNLILRQKEDLKVCPAKEKLIGQLTTELAELEAQETVASAEAAAAGTSVADASRAEQVALVDSEFWKANEGNKDGSLLAKVKDLLEKGADARAVSRYKNTSLHYAMVYKAGPEVVELLLAKGADVHVVNEGNMTVLHYAMVYEAGPEVVALLLEKGGADVHAVDNDKRTALHYAARNQAGPKVVELLLEKGADVRAEDKDKKTALHYAARNQAGHEVVKLLQQPEPSSEKIEDKFLAEILPKLKEITTEIEGKEIGKDKAGNDIHTSVKSIPIEKNLYKELFMSNSIGSVVLKDDYNKIIQDINDELQFKNKKIVKIMADNDILTEEGDNNVNVTFFAVNKDDIAKVPTATAAKTEAPAVSPSENTEDKLLKKILEKFGETDISSFDQYINEFKIDFSDDKLYDYSELFDGSGGLKGHLYQKFKDAIDKKLSASSKELQTIKKDVTNNELIITMKKKEQTSSSSSAAPAVKQQYPPPLKRFLRDKTYKYLKEKVSTIKLNAEKDDNKHDLHKQARKYYDELLQIPPSRNNDNVDDEDIDEIINDYPLVNNELTDLFIGGKRRRTRWRPRTKKSNKTYRKKPKKIRQKKNKTQRKRKR